MEDVTRWEAEFTDAVPAQPSSSTHSTLPSSSYGMYAEGSPGKQRDFGSSPPRAPTEYEFDGDLDGEDGQEFDEEVEAYAEEYARAVQEQEQGESQREGPGHEDTLEGLENLPEDELFGEWNWSEEDGDGMDMS